MRILSYKDTTHCWPVVVTSRCFGEVGAILRHRKSLESTCTSLDHNNTAEMSCCPPPAEITGLLIKPDFHLAYRQPFEKSINVWFKGNFSIRNVKHIHSSEYCTLFVDLPWKFGIPNQLGRMLREI